MNSPMNRCIYGTHRQLTDLRRLLWIYFLDDYLQDKQVFICSCPHPDMACVRMAPNQDEHLARFWRD